MNTFQDFDVDEYQIGLLCASARKTEIKKIAEVDRLRREIRHYEEQAEKTNDDTEKAIHEHHAEMRKDRVRILMRDVGMYERPQRNFGRPSRPSLPA